MKCRGEKKEDTIKKDSQNHVDKISLAFCHCLWGGHNRTIGWCIFLCYNDEVAYYYLCIDPPRYRGLSTMFNIYTIKTKDNNFYINGFLR